MANIPEAGDVDSSSTIVQDPQSSEDAIPSLGSDGRSTDCLLEWLESCLTVKTEAFAGYLTGLVKNFITNNTTHKEEIGAMIRCLSRCIDNLNSTAVDEGLVLNYQIPEPENDDSEDLPIDEHRRIALALLDYFKGHTLELFLTALVPPSTAVKDDAVRALKLILNQVRECDNLIDRVMFEGYDCRVDDLSDGE